MEKIYAILAECCPAVNPETDKAIVTDKVIDSFDLMNLVTALEDEFSINIDMDMIRPKNFDSAEAMYALVQNCLG